MAYWYWYCMNHYFCSSEKYSIESQLIIEKWRNGANPCMKLFQKKTPKESFKVLVLYLILKLIRLSLWWKGARISFYKIWLRWLTMLVNGGNCKKECKNNTELLKNICLCSITFTKLWATSIKKIIYGSNICSDLFWNVLKLCSVGPRLVACSRANRWTSTSAKSLIWSAPSR